VEIPVGANEVLIVGRPATVGGRKPMAHREGVAMLRAPAAVRGERSERLAPAALLALAICAGAGERAFAASTTAEAPPIKLAVATKVLHGGAFENRSSEEVYREIARQADVDVAFAPDLRHSQVSVLLDEMTVARALSLLERLTGHLVVPVTDRSILVLRDTPVNQEAHIAVRERQFAIQNANPGELATMLRSVIDVSVATVDETRRTLTVSAPDDKLELAERLIAIHDRRPWRVRLEIGRAQMGTPVDTGHFPAALTVLGPLDRTQVGFTNPLGAIELVGSRPTTWIVEPTTVAGGADATAARSGDSLRVVARVHRSSREVTLDLSLLGSDGRQVDHSGLRIRDGATVLLQVPKGVATDSKVPRVDVLALTPRVVELGETPPGDSNVIWFGTQMNLLPFDPQPILTGAYQVLRGREAVFDGRSSEEAYREVARQGGITVMFEPGLHHGAVHLDLDGLRVEEALRRISASVRHYAVTLSERAVLVLPDTPVVHRAHEPMGFRVFKLENANARDLLPRVRQLTLSAIADREGVTLTLGARASEMQELERLVDYAESKAELVARQALIEASRRRAIGYEALNRPSMGLPYHAPSVAAAVPPLRVARGLRTGCPSVDELPAGMTGDEAYAGALECLEQRLLDARRQGDVYLEIQVSIELIYVAHSTPDDIARWRDQALQLAQAKGDPCLVSFVLLEGWRRETQVAEVARAANRAIEVARAGGCNAELATALSILAETLRGDAHQKALAFFQESAALAKELDDVRLYVADLSAMARLYTELEDPRAIRIREELVQYLRSHGQERAAWEATWDLGLTLIHLGNLHMGNVAAGQRYLESYIAYRTREGEDVRKEIEFLKALREHRVVEGRWYAGRPPGS
jgi:hypothetical protein